MRGSFLEQENFHRLIDEKKWALVLHELDLLIAKKDSESDEIIFSTFEKIDRNYREGHAQKFYFEMWKIAYRLGKVKKGNEYAEFILNYLIEFKRIPAIKKLLDELALYGVLKNHKNIFALESLLGKKGSMRIDDFHSFEFHPEMWKSSKKALKEYLLQEEKWDLAHWKLAYEYILKFHYDRELMILLAEKTTELKKDVHQKKFISFLQGKKVSTKKFTEKKITTQAVSSETPLKADYDQIAMDVMSGIMEPSLTEQKKVLLSVADMTDEELLTKGKDMIVAFGLLGMDKVVVSLSERMIPLLKNIKDRASIQFMLAQSLFNSGDFYKVSDLVDDVMISEPLLQDEAMAFFYLKAESLLGLKKYKAAKDIFLQVKKYNPNYRMVSERLRNLEEIK